ncbi:MAG: peptidyl-prolyl cis-trans isomerase [Planctomycetia bacterium]|nr:peptidyl-prolyl cis-trans isomerase [Planctomycetia bacterium]
MGNSLILSAQETSDSFDVPDFSGNLNFSPSVVASRTYYEGAETIGRVGYESILKSDLLHQLKKLAYATYLEQIDQVVDTEEVKALSEAEFEKQKTILRQNILNEYLTNSEIYSHVLDNHIRGLLYYNDFVVSRPKDQVLEQKKHLSELFETEQIPLLLKQFRCKNRRELEQIFKNEIESSIAQEKRIFVQELLGGSWLSFNLGNDSYEPTIVDLRRYYEAHRDLYEEPAKVRWQAMSVLIANYPSRAEAYNKLAQMGNKVQQGQDFFEQEQLFCEVAKASSEDYFASKGGIRDWTQKGSLNSDVLEDMIFSEELPVGQMSKIIEDSGSFIIVRVIQREPLHWKPFVQVQEDVREKMEKERREVMQKKYEEALSQRYTIELYDITQDERRSIIESAQNQDFSVTGR